MKTFKKTYFEILFIIGLLLSALVSFDRGYHFLPDFIGGMLTSLSIVLIVFAGIVKHSKKLQDRLQIADTDERLLAIEQKATKITLYSIMFIDIVCIIIFGFLGDPYLYMSILLATILFITIAILFITKLVLAKRM